MTTAQIPATIGPDASMTRLADEPLPAPTPLGLIQMAMSQGCDVDKLERLIALQDRMMAHNAEVEFNAALGRVQAAMGRVSADSNNPQTKSKYSSYAAIDRVCRPLYTAEGFALSFDTEAGPSTETMWVLGLLLHASGHSRTYRTLMPTDGKGAKGGDVMTKTHAAGSAMTYGMRYLVKLIFNVAVGEDDNDGNGAGGGIDNQMPEAEFQNHIARIREAADDEALKAAYTAALGALHKDDQQTQRAFIDAKNNRYRALHPRTEGGSK